MGPMLTEETIFSWSQAKIDMLLAWIQGPEYGPPAFLIPSTAQSRFSFT